MTDNEFKKIFPFTTPRNGQRELIEKIINTFNSGKKHIILNAPTGWGKSVIAYSIISYYNNGYILTSQKCLQEQYHRDLDIPYILGKANYKCKENSSLTCAMGMCKGIYANGCKLNCTYRVYKDRAFDSSIMNMNYNYFLSINSSTTSETGMEASIPHRNLMVLDECHNLENELIKKCSLQLSDTFLYELGIQEHIPDVSESEDNMFIWLFNTIRPRLLEQYLYYRNLIRQYNVFRMSREFKKAAYKLDAITKTLSLIDEINLQRKEGQKIIINFSNEKLEFKLLYANRLFNTYISTVCDKFLHMSATILDKSDYCRNLGINESDAEYISADAIFPKENRLIHYTPIGSLTYNNKQQTMPKLIEQISILLKKYSNCRGIIHTGNYQIAEAIINSLYYTDEGKRLIMPRGNDRQNILNKFYESNAPYVLISPSLTEGLDLKDDLSRFCIICKVPYMSLGDIWVKTRMEENNRWYLINTAQTIVQMTGRSIRSEEDYCDTYILDSNFIDFAKRAMNILPNWWKESVMIN